MYLGASSKYALARIEFWVPALSVRHWETQGTCFQDKICHADLHTVEICGEIALVAPNEGSPDILLKRRSAEDQI